MGKLSGVQKTVRVKIGPKLVTVKRDQPTSVPVLARFGNWGALKMKLCDECAKEHGGFTDSAYKKFMKDCQKRHGKADQATLWLTSKSKGIPVNKNVSDELLSSAVKRTKQLFLKNPTGTFDKLKDAIITPGVKYVTLRQPGRKTKNARTVKSPARPYS